MSRERADRGGSTAGEERCERPEEDWRLRLGAARYHVMREGGTEPPFTGRYVSTKTSGVYRCAACGRALFDSGARFASGTGWPSFTSPAGPEAVRTRPDTGLGMRRTEVLCAGCDSHLGHVFEDGPGPTGLRYCINSIALELDPEP